MIESFQNNLVTSLPDITSIEFKKIDKSYFKVILINFFLVFIPLFVGLILLHQFVFEDEINQYIVFIYVSFLLFFGFIFIYLWLGFSKRKYALREKDIEIIKDFDYLHEKIETNKYLIDKGVSPDRIIDYKGYGEDKIINGCNSTSKCTEAQHLSNRRTEFVVVKMN